jgi:hypothetical protein
MVGGVDRREALADEASQSGLDHDAPAALGTAVHVRGELEAARVREGVVEEKVDYAFDIVTKHSLLFLPGHVVTTLIALLQLGNQPLNFKRRKKGGA